VLGPELAASLLFTSAKVRPAVLEAEGFVFTDPQLEGALRRLLMPALETR
jgi:NAD dependent epimerase/dehydratase family enzyme